MAKKINKKKKTNKKTATKRVAREKKYESHYLAIFLVAFLLLQGTLMTTTNSSNWQSGVAVLDVSGAVSQTISDTAAVFEPITTAVQGVNQFYALATDQMTQLLDLSGSNAFGEVTEVASGVNDFYSQAATQMAQVLDVSSYSPWQSGAVAGASTSLR